MYENDQNDNVEGAVGYERMFSNENIYESVNNDPNDSNDNDNIYERIANNPTLGQITQSITISEDSRLVNEMPSCSVYGRIGNTYGRLDIIGQGIGRIERHLSSSCSSGMDNNHYALENCYGTIDGTGRISKVSVQWLLVNKWLPMWISNTGSGIDYKVLDFLSDQTEDSDDGSR